MYIGRRTTRTHLWGVSVRLIIYIALGDSRAAVVLDGVLIVNLVAVGGYLDRIVRPIYRLSSLGHGEKIVVR
jgi:hypothetical protein